MTQTAFAIQSPRVLSRVITSHRDFDGLFEGYSTLQGVSYVVSPDLLLDFFQKRGFSQVEVVVGENLTGHHLLDQYRQSLSQKGTEVALALAQLVEQGKLRVLVPKRTLHSKLYLLRNERNYRVIQASANFTETARLATSQVNYAWYADLPPDDPWLAQVVDDYHAHTKDCAQFMGDLVELLKGEPNERRQEIAEAWLKGKVDGEEELEGRKVLQELTARSLTSLEESIEPVLILTLPDAPKARKQVERFLAPLGPEITDHRASVNALRYVRYVWEHHAVPLMQVDLPARAVRLSIDGPVAARSEPLPDGEHVSQALEHIEAYVNTVDWGRCLDPQFAKASMFEALLYFLAAPFAHEHMKLRRQSYGLVDYRGPQVLYIFGRAQNGKSTFLRFALRLLTGQHVSAQPGAQFSKTKVQGTAAVGTVFPLVFDDVDFSRNARTFEEVMKSYWEVWWREECVVPQLTLTGNADNLKDWAKSRLKRVDFDVQFAPSEIEKARLNKILEVDNPLFKWFSHLYMESLARGETPGEDELRISRSVMRDLYRHAGRSAPSFFPDQPLERLYDPGRKAWRDVIHVLRKAAPQRQGQRLLITFKEEMQHNEVRAYAGHLPQTVKKEIKGKTIVIESPVEFDRWLKGADGASQSWRDRLGRLFGR
ncbi:MAG: phospholipase D family protein [Chloroflexi bacterium]|nr:phospholipase D family protein [Chloroflexota bacterium]